MRRQMEIFQFVFTSTNAEGLIVEGRTLLVDFNNLSISSQALEKLLHFLAVRASCFAACITTPP